MGKLISLGKLKTVLFIIPLLFLFLSCEDKKEDKHGCLDSQACNYDSDATIENNSCEYLDCNNECGGDAVLDSCDVCDDDPSNDCVQDCADVWGGDAYIDECGQCMCGTNGDPDISECDDDDECEQGCDGEWYSDLDDLPIIDNCGVCDADISNDCTQDCNGNWDGEAYVNACGYCAGGESGIEESYCNPINDIDGNEYQAVAIGEQVWMAENLKVTHYRNGDEIPTGYSNSEWANLSTGAYVGYDDNPDNADVYGYLYNWYAVDDERGVCPDDWHVPTDEEWTFLEDFITNDGYTGIEGNALKEIGYEHWNDDGNPDHEGLDIYGFTALPGGFRYGYDGTYYDMGNEATFWSYTEDSSDNAWYWRPVYAASEIYRGNHSKLNGFSVRCIKD